MIRRALATQYIYIFFLTFCIGLFASAQGRIEGVVIDAETERPLSGVSIKIVENNQGTSTDAEGRFSFNSSKILLEVTFSIIGYEGKVVKIVAGGVNRIQLEPDGLAIEAVDIQIRRKYSNKNNPAVELIDLVIDHKAKNRVSGKDRIQFDQYDKLKVSMVDPPAALRNAFSGFENLDDRTIKGKQLMTFYLEENQAKIYSQKDPSRYKKIIHHQKKTEFDSRYINNPNIQSYFNYIFQPIDIYDESIFMLNRLFLSPIADKGKLYYKYFIQDTVTNEHGQFIKLKFVPRNENDLLFTGNLTVSMDGAYAVKEANLFIGEIANLNWANGVDITVNYSPNEMGTMLLEETNMSISFGRKDSQAAYVERKSYHSNYDLKSAVDDAIFGGAPIEISKSVSSEMSNRPVDLSSFELSAYSNIEKLNADPSFRGLMTVGYVLSQSYYNMNKFEFGPVEYTYSKNNIEGNRFRVGGRTTPLLSEKLYMEGYLAYGDLDDRWKYFLKTAVSLNGESVAKFPAHYLEATVQHDNLDPGREINIRRGDSFFQSFRRNRPTRWFATDAYQLRHVVEFGNHISLTTGFTHTQRKTLGEFRLVSSGDPDLLVTNMNTNDAHVILRWAPYEKFYYRNLTRATVIEKYPVFTVQYNRGLKGFWDGNYDYDKLSASASKRFFLNQFGFADMTVTGGKIWGTLPYTLLYMPNIQQNIGRHDIDYNLMNSMEFAADEYVKVGFEHELQGYILNKIPFIKRLRLREIWGAQMFYGKMSDHNNPLLSNQVVHFDKNSDGIPFTHGLGTTPYWEASVGLDNILRILKVEYVKRLTHRDLPDISKDRIRVNLSINF